MPFDIRPVSGASIQCFTIPGLGFLGTFIESQRTRKRICSEAQKSLTGSQCGLVLRSTRFHPNSLSTSALFVANH